MDPASVRGWWWHRQGLDGSLDGATPADVLERTGWARSVGGVNPYLTLFARAATARAAVDAAAAAALIHELPSARGCTYILPRSHFGLGLQVGRGASEGEVRVLAKLGVDRAEVDRLCAAVRKTLDGGATMDPAQLRDALGEAVRSLGEEGRRKGQSTTLPAALGLLQAAGEIRRVPIDGRLDQQRYAYTRWSAPASGLDDAGARAELARLYFDWTAPASLAHFRWFSGFTVAHAKAAVAGLGLVEVDGLLASEQTWSQVAAYRPEARPRYHLLAGIDALFLLRRDLAALVDGPLSVPGEKQSVGGGLSDLTDHAIVDRGRLVGLWQYDQAAGAIVWWLAGGASPDRALRQAIERTEAYIRDELGDARSFSLDSPKSRAPRLAALRSGDG